MLPPMELELLPSAATAYTTATSMMNDLARESQRAADSVMGNWTQQHMTSLAARIDLPDFNESWAVKSVMDALPPQLTGAQGVGELTGWSTHIGDLAKAMLPPMELELLPSAATAYTTADFVESREGWAEATASVGANTGTDHAPSRRWDARDVIVLAIAAVAMTIMGLLATWGLSSVTSMVGFATSVIPALLLRQRV
jgi:hypothetical protein